MTYLEKSFDAVESEILGPKKDWSNIEIIDTGANLLNFVFDNDRDLVIEKSKKYGVKKVIHWTTSMKNSVKAAQEG